MDTLTGFERMTQFLRRKPMDRIPVYEDFWSDTIGQWTAQGHIKESDYNTHFGYDLRGMWGPSFIADMGFEPQILREDEDTIVILDGNGATLRRHKHHDSTPEHINFLVKDRATWEEHIRPLVTQFDDRRVQRLAYREVKQLAAQHNQYFCMFSLGVFECIHPVCGHLNMLIGMVDDPEWVRDMADAYTEMIIRIFDVLIADEGKPDAFWFFEDMGFKERPFMSPAMYRELIMPAHKRLFDYAHRQGCPVIVHSCGCVEKLIPGLVEAGMDCLQVIEVKAGMDLLKLYREYGDRLSFMGGIDVREICSNDRERIDAELKKKIPVVMQGNGFCLHSDHSIPSTVDYDTYRYLLECAKEIGTYR